MPTSGRLPRCVIYTRVSRDDTGEGKSTQRQEEDCRKLAELKGYEVVKVLEDRSVSAYGKKARPQWEEVLRLVEAGEVQAIIAWHLDRITRNMVDLEKLVVLAEQKSISVLTVSGDIDLSGDMGRMLARILAAVARGEVERKTARQKRANAQRRAEGQPWRSGWASFGYDLNKEVIPEQAEMIRQAAEAVLGGASLKSVARSWRAAGVSTPRSSLGADGWTHNGVRSILLNPVNAGIATYKGEEIGKGNWEAILSEATLRQLQALLTDPGRRTHQRRGRTAENLLSGIAICGTCGATVTAGVSNGRKVYKCSNPVGEHLTTARDEADAFVLSAMTGQAEVFASESVLPRLEAETENSDLLMAELSSLDLRERNITERFVSNAISRENWAMALDAINALRSDLTARLAQAEGAQRTVAAMASARVTAFRSLSLRDKRFYLAELAEIRLHPRNRRRNVPIAEQVTIFARDSRRLSPLIAGAHPEATREAALRIAARDDATIEARGESFVPDFEE